MDGKILDYKLTEAKAELVKGEQSQEAIVNQQPKESVVNTITVDEVKEEVKKGVDSIPETDLSGYYTKSQVDTLFPKKTDVSSNTLLGSVALSKGESDNVEAIFTNVDTSKITSKTLLIFTAMNCFVIGMLSQTGEGRVVGLVPTASGTVAQARVKFQLSGTTLSVITSAAYGFGSSPATAYLFAFSVI